jgi:virginiamycin B lyase
MKDRGAYWLGWALVAVVAIAPLAACSGGSAGSALPAAQPVGSAPSHAAKLKATVSITIPKGKHHRIPRHGHYVSSATESVAIVITGGVTTTLKANLTPGSSNCNANSGTTFCRFTFLLTPRTYTATFATYDGMLDGSGNPQGNELSANQSASFKVTAGAANTIDVTLDGIPTSVAFTPAESSTLSGSITGYTLSKCGSDQVTITGLDADGKTIIGPGAPTAQLRSNGTALVVTDSSEAPNQFTITRPSAPPPSPGSKVYLTAYETPLAASGAAQVHTAAIPMTFNHDICGYITQFTVPTANSQPKGIATGPDGNLWFTEYKGNKIGRVTTAGVFTEYTVTTTASEPNDIVAGPDGKLWFTESQGSNIGSITTGGTVAEYATPTSGAEPLDITTGADGALWFTEGSATNFGRITTGGSAIEYPTNGAPGPRTYGIATGSDDNMYVTTAFDGNSVVQASTAGAVLQNYALPNTFPSQGGPMRITSGPDGNLWFGEADSNIIGRVTTSGTFTPFTVPEPFQQNNPAIPGITTGPDGALWFTECASGFVGRITTSGTVTEFPVTPGSNTPDQIITGPDGNLWFTQVCTNEVSRIE